jgi:hypothetical protein
MKFAATCFSAGVWAFAKPKVKVAIAKMINFFMMFIFNWLLRLLYHELVPIGQTF